MNPGPLAPQLTRINYLQGGFNENPRLNDTRFGLQLYARGLKSPQSFGFGRRVDSTDSDCLAFAHAPTQSQTAEKARMPESAHPFGEAVITCWTRGRRRDSTVCPHGGFELAISAVIRSRCRLCSDHDSTQTDAGV